MRRLVIALMALTLATPEPSEELRVFAQAHEHAGFDRILVPASSSSPDTLLTVNYAAAVTDKIKFLLAHRRGGLHQVLHPVGPYRLDDVGTDCLQEHVAILLSSMKNRSSPAAHCTMRRKLA